MRATLTAVIFLTSLGAHAASPPSSKNGLDSGEKPNIYNPVGKRDPFRQPIVAGPGRDVTAVNPIEKYAVEQLQLRAILRGIGKAKAMFEDPEGKTHIVNEGDILGRERATVSKILNNEVIVTERTFNYLGQESLYEKILSLPAETDLGQSDAGPARAPQAAMPGAANAVPNPLQQEQAPAQQAPVSAFPAGVSAPPQPDAGALTTGK